MAEEPAAPVPAGTEPAGPCPTAATPPCQGPAADAQAAPLRIRVCPTLPPWPCGAPRKPRKLVKEMQPYVLAELQNLWGSGFPSGLGLGCKEVGYLDLSAARAHLLFPASHSSLA